MYAALWLFAVAFGWIEALTVVYLRAGASSSLSVTLVALPERLIALEVVREAFTIVILGAVAWLAGRRLADRAGAFALSFGIWDLTYYAALFVVSGWPDSLAAWDILFLIPIPWVAPVWAPAAVAALMVITGHHLFWTAERERRYGWRDIGVLVAAAALIITSFLVESGSAINQSTPETFPVWLYAAGVVLGVLWFVRVERRTATGTYTKRPWVGVRLRTILPNAPGTRNRAGTVRALSVEHAPIGADDVAIEYGKARMRLEALQREASDLGERLERVAHGLSAHPARMIIGFPDRFIDPSDWDIVPGHPLPSMERLAALTDEIRNVSAEVEDLRERLILMGRSNLVQQPDKFFR